MEMRRLRVLCLHGHGDNSRQLQAQLSAVKWDDSVLNLLDLSFLDAPFPVIDGEKRNFAPPYLEWFRGNKEMTIVDYKSFEQGISCISRYMKKCGPFDGLLGMSLGGFVAGALAGMQQTKKSILPTELKFVIIISGGIIRCQPLCKVYDHPIHCPSFHLIGELDTIFKSSGEDLAKKFVKPIIIVHPYGHCLPPLDNASTVSFVEFLQDIIKENVMIEIKEHSKSSLLIVAIAFCILVFFYFIFVWNF
ncbi:hypothetical protein SELMODRAFT_227576 [Selaginella moellendorffii]|uniref:Serine hydrolase domain-containing protein n=2 Tax=Selaginella moellendorffii TaxID=88036 RepID=D8R3N6_SELML|nr:hypothetical protein SELMODRAFT_227576 [Selaginella moellendorffii]